MGNDFARSRTRKLEAVAARKVFSAAFSVAVNLARSKAGASSEAEEHKQQGTPPRYGRVFLMIRICIWLTL